MRAIYLIVLLSISSLTAFAQHDSSNDDRSVDGMIPLYDSIITFRMDDFGSPWNPFSLERNFEYDNASNYLSSDVYDHLSGNWVHSEKIVMSYNAENQLTRKTVLGYIAPAQLDTLSDNVREYDNNGNRTLYVVRERRSASLAISYRETATYDDNHNQLTKIIERSDYENDPLKFFQQDVNTYVNNLMETTTILKWVNNAWVNEWKYLYTRNDNGLVLETVVMYWLESGVWSEHHKLIYSYDDQGNNTQTLKVNKTDGGYVDHFRIIQTYTGNKVSTYTYELFNDNQWTMWYKDSSEYDANLNLVRFRSYDRVGNDFGIYEDLRQTFDSENIMTSKVWYHYNNYDVPPTLNYADSTLYYFKRVLGGKEEIPAANVTIYPNPTKDVVRINSTTPAVKVEIYNLSGIRLAEYPANTTEVYLNWLPAGTYIFRTITKQGVHCNKILVE